MTEKDVFLATHQRECQTTHRLISALPASQADFKPHERARSAKELAFTLANHELFFEQAAEGKMDPSLFGTPVPATMAQVLEALEKNRDAVDQAVQAVPEADLSHIVNFMGHDMRRLDVMWGNLYDLIHHRGQFSVYVRMSGAKVPSIYGPTADYPMGASA